MNKKYSSYNTIIFDCDGVILNSNKIKTFAFRDTVIKYGKNYAEELVKYNLLNGGISRKEKFIYFINNIYQDSSHYFQKPTAKELIEQYSILVKKELYNCEIAEDIFLLKEKLKGKKSLVVSGSEQQELRDVFNHRRLNILFPDGIFGSPDNKTLIFKREIKNNNILYPALYLGDSKYDYESSNKFNIDFLFISKWTEVKNWKEWCFKNSINYVNSLKDFLNMI